MSIKIFSIKQTILFVLFTALSGILSVAFAHGDELDVSSSGSKGAIVLSTKQIDMLGIRTVAAKNQSISENLLLNGQVQLLPNNQAEVSIRISGQVTALYANLGDLVEKGQPLVKIQSRLIGEPPPSVIIKAPMAGIIDARNITLGQSVEPNTVLFHLSDRNQMLVITNAFEEDIGKLKIGQKAIIHALSFPNQQFSGQVTTISPDLDANTRTVPVWITTSNKENLLKPNMFAQANILTQQKTSVLVIPKAAILEVSGEKTVFVQKNNQFQRVEITTGLEEGSLVEVTHGLSTGMLVVIQGQQQLLTLWLTGGQLKTEE